MAELLKSHSAVIEWPTTEWLAEKFPKMNWQAMTNNVFARMWVACAMEWGRVLAEWEEAENFAVIRPSHPIPIGGLLDAIGWSRKRGEAAQKELIGMTAESEVVSYFSTYGAATSSTAGAGATFETEDT